MLNNGDRVTHIDVNNGLVPISGNIYNLDGTDGIITRYPFREQFVPMRDIIFDNKLYYVTLKNAVTYKIINNYESFARLFGKGDIKWRAY